MIIGLAGKYCSGKDTAAGYLVQKGFIHHSLSDILRGEATSRGLANTRERLIALGNELRLKFGPAVLANLTLEQLDHRDFVISSIRNPAEVNALRSRKDFFLIALDAPPELRWKRLVERSGRRDDISTFEQFCELEAAEQNSDPTKQQLHLVLTMADFTVQNSLSEEELYAQMDSILSRKKNESPLFSPHM